MPRILVDAPQLVREELGPRFEEFKNRATTLAQKYDLLNTAEWRAFLSELRLLFEEIFGDKLSERPLIHFTLILAPLTRAKYDWDKKHWELTAYTVIPILYVKKRLLGLRRRLEEVKILVGKYCLRSGKDTVYLDPVEGGDPGLVGKPLKVRGEKMVVEL